MWTERTLTPQNLSWVNNTQHNKHEIDSKKIFFIDRRKKVDPKKNPRRKASKRRRKNDDELEWRKPKLLLDYIGFFHQ